MRLTYKYVEDHLNYQSPDGSTFSYKTIKKHLEFSRKISKGLKISPIDSFHFIVDCFGSLNLHYFSQIKEYAKTFKWKIIKKKENVYIQRRTGSKTAEKFNLIDILNGPDEIIFDLLVQLTVYYIFFRGNNIAIKNKFRRVLKVCYNIIY
jgi:hypothetical protein